MDNSTIVIHGVIRITKRIQCIVFQDEYMGAAFSHIFPTRTSIYIFDYSFLKASCHLDRSTKETIYWSRKPMMN